MLELEIVAPNGRRLTDAALVDTGADTSAFPLHWMRRLGIYKKDCRKRQFDTAGGCADQWSFADGVEAIILGQRVTLRAVFVDAPVALLGRDDFLASFRVNFDQRAQLFTVEPYV
jgi:hypothetical protein